MSNLANLIAEIESNENMRNLEVFKHEYWEMELDGNTEIVLNDMAYKDLFAKGYDLIETGSAWFFWFAVPGCLPDSEPFGPYGSEEGALRHALEMFGNE